MENPTTEDTAMGEPEIAARLERATRSVLVSSSLASYSYFQSSSARGKLSQPPSLADLLPHLGSPEAPRCPSCRASLPFGSRSRLCLACAVPLLQPSAPFFTSTLAYRHLSEALHMDGLETDLGEAGEEHFSDPEVDFATKSSSSSFSLPLEVYKQEVLLHADVSSYRGMPPYVEPKTVKSDVQTPLPLTSTSGAGDLGSANVDRDKHTSILDYSAKLEGISLEDFFTNQVKPQAPAQLSETSGNFEDLFGNFSNMKERGVGESVNFQSNNGLVNNGDLLGLDTNIQNSLKADTQNSSDVDSLFGSGWHLNVPPFMASTTSDSQGSKKQSSLLESNKEDLLGPISSQLMETRIVNNSSFAFVEELTSTATNDDELLTERQTSPSTEKKNKIVRSLLAQLPDLSFLLADKLVMNTEGQKTNPDTSR